MSSRGAAPGADSSPVGAIFAQEDAGGPLVLSGAGSTLVATDVMFAQIELLQRMQVDVTTWQGRLDRIRRLDRNPAPGWVVCDAGPSLLAASIQLHGLLVDARSLGDRLMTAAEAYTRAETQATWLLRQSGAVNAWFTGLLLPLILVGVAPPLAAGVLGALVGAWATGRNPTQLPQEFVTWLDENPRILTNPLIVEAVRVVMGSVDDFAGGRMGVPLGASLGLGEDGLGLLGTATSAASVLAVIRPLGILADSPVIVAPAPVSRPHPEPPRSITELAERIPAAEAQAPQVRIEQYGTAQAPAWVVYSGGTVEWNPAESTDPWDLASNLDLVAGQDGASYRAVIAAMREAGIGPNDPVIQVGHSQGGAVAAQVAASGLFRSVLVATFGAPRGSARVSTPTVVVEHLDDIVPALGGTATTTTTAAAAAPTRQRLVVRREAFQGRSVPRGVGLPAHSMTEYRRTAALIDTSPDSRLRALADTVAATVGTSPGTATAWVGRRTPAPPAPRAAAG